MYSSARSAATRRLSSSKLSGLGTRPSSGTLCPGFVPQDTYGESRPVLDNKTKDHRAQNRRVVIKVLE